MVNTEARKESPEEAPTTILAIFFSDPLFGHGLPISCWALRQVSDETVAGVSTLQTRDILSRTRQVCRL